MHSYDTFVFRNSVLRDSGVANALAERVAKLPFAKHPYFRFKPTLEGYQGYVFGGRAGPNVGPWNVTHELAHAAEFGHENFRTRNLMGAFHFRVHRVYFQGEGYVEQRTGQATERECRTIGLQMHLLQAIGIQLHDDRFLQDAMCSMAFMPDSFAADNDGKSQLIVATRDRYSSSEVFERVEAWLDKTAARLRRQKTNLPTQTQLLAA